MKNSQKMTPARFALFSCFGGILLLVFAYFLSNIFSSDLMSASFISDLFSNNDKNSAIEIGDAFDQIKGETSLPSSSLFDLIKTIIQIVLGLFSVLLTGVALWSGTLFVAHFGEEQVTNARKLLTWSLVGVLVTASSYALISGFLNLDFGG